MLSFAKPGIQYHLIHSLHFIEESFLIPWLGNNRVLFFFSNFSLWNLSSFCKLKQHPIKSWDNVMKDSSSPFSTLNPKLLKTLKEITRSLKLCLTQPVLWHGCHGHAVCWKVVTWALQGSAVWLLVVNQEKDLWFPKDISVCSSVQIKPTVLQDDMWASTTFQSPIICEQSRSKPMFTQNGGFVSRDPLVQNPWVHSLKCNPQKWINKKGERACVSKRESTEVTLLRSTTSSGEQWVTPGVLSATVRKPESGTDGFLSGYGSCLQGNHWSVIKKSRGKYSPKA